MAAAVTAGQGRVAASIQVQSVPIRNDQTGVGCLLECVRSGQFLKLYKGSGVACSGSRILRAFVQLRRSFFHVIHHHVAAPFPWWRWRQVHGINAATGSAVSAQWWVCKSQVGLWQKCVQEVGISLHHLSVLR